MASPASVPLASSFPTEQVLGIGRTGVVILQEQAAVKLPLRWSTSSDDQVQANIESLKHEQEIYLRLEDCDGVVQLLGCSETATRLRLMENGDLRTYLSRNRRPSNRRQLSWFREMARTLARIHDHRIIVVDIASRNLLLDSDLSVKFCDFTESTKLPLDACMETADDGGYTIRTDIGQLGAVMYEVLTEQHCEFDIFKDVPSEVSHGSWPRSEELPSTENVWLGQIIEKCWTEGAFRNAYDLLSALESVNIDDELPKQRKICQGSGPLKRLVSRLEGILFSPITLATLGAILLYIWSQRRGCYLQIVVRHLFPKLSITQT